MVQVVVGIPLGVDDDVALGSESGEGERADGQTIKSGRPSRASIMDSTGSGCPKSHQKPQPGNQKGGRHFLLTPIDRQQSKRKADLPIFAFACLTTTRY